MSIHNLLVENVLLGRRYHCLSPAQAVDDTVCTGLNVARHPGILLTLENMEMS